MDAIGKAWVGKKSSIYIRKDEQINPPEKIQLEKKDFHKKNFFSNKKLYKNLLKPPTPQAVAIADDKTNTTV